MVLILATMDTMIKVPPTTAEVFPVFVEADVESLIFSLPFP